MQLVTFLYREVTRIGALVEKNSQNFIFDLNRAQPNLPSNMIAFLQAGDAAMMAARNAVAQADE